MSGTDARTRSQHEHALLDRVLRHYPDLAGKPFEVMSGQFNDVVIVDSIVFRHPRTDGAAETIAREIAVLNGLQGRLPIPIPTSAFSRWSGDGSGPLFMGYRMLPGRPFDHETLERLWGMDRTSFNRCGAQMGVFLRTLHAIDVSKFDIGLPILDGVTYWRTMLDAFRNELFDFMGPDARVGVERDFSAFLTGDGSKGWKPVLRHGDFGGSNLLFDDDARRVSGVIDFGSVALGDPAVDLAALAAFDARLAHAMQPHYPELFLPAV